MSGGVRSWVVSFAAMVVISGTLVSAVANSAGATPSDQPKDKKAEHGQSGNNDVSAPLRDLKPANKVTRQEHADSPMPVPAGAIVADPVAQQTATWAAAPSSSSFPGVGANGSAPSDDNGAVGPAYFFQIVNTEIAIYPKTGASLGAAVLGPVTTNTLWSGFGGGCQTNNDGDGTVRYDALADRWIVSQFSLGPTGNGPFLQCIAVSTTADPTGSYYRYSFSFANFPDYPKLGVWPDGYYQTMNTFSAAGSFLGAETCAYDREKMLNGQAATMQCFVMNPALYGAFLPGDLDGVNAPPAGEPNAQIGLGADNTHLASLRFHVDWNNPANTVLNETDVAVAVYTGACSNGGTCVPQLGTSQQLDSLADRVMYRFGYRNLGTPASPNEHWVVTYSVTANGSSAPRWWEFGTPVPGSGSLSVLQDSTFAPDTNHRWMGSTAQDQTGNIALGYSESSSAMHPAIGFTGHQVGTDPINTMEPETVMYAGAGSQTTNLNRWGDYSSMAADTSDGCTFWYTNQYIPSNGTFNWQTRIGSFAFPSCAPRTDSDFSIALFPAFGSLAAPATGSSTATSTLTTATTAGSSQTITLSAAAPVGSGIGASFAPTSASPGSPSTLTLSVPAGTSPGVYPISISAAGPLTPSPHSATYWLTVLAPGINNGGFETGDLSFWTVTAGSATVNTCGPHAGTYAAWLGSTAANCGAATTSGDSSISQTFTLAQAGTLSFWYDTSCPDTVQYDWATATLTDNTTNTTTTLLPKTCTTSAGWVQVTNALGASSVGHSLTLTLTSHDDNYPTDPTVTKFDDVTLATASSGDYSLSASPSSQTVTAGSTTSPYTVTVAPSNGFSGTVAFSASGLPSGATVTFNPPSISGSPWTSQLTIATAASTPGGSYNITVTGASGALTHTTTVTLVVRSFTVAVSPSSRSIRRGNSTTYTVTITALNGFTGTELLSASGLPSGASASFSPASITNAGTSTLTITTTTSTATGTRTLTISATGGGITKTTTATLTVTKR